MSWRGADCPWATSFRACWFAPAPFPHAKGTPEPGGYMWNETMHLLDSIVKYNEIVAVDVVEFAPIKGIEAYDFVVAKLCYEILKKISNSC